MSLWGASQRRWPDDTQLEYCELCGRKVPADDRIQGVAQGLAGRWLCDKCADFGLNLSYLDYGGPGNSAPIPDENLPHSGADWIGESQNLRSLSSFYCGATFGEVPQATGNFTFTSTTAYFVPVDEPRFLTSRTPTRILLAVGAQASDLKIALYQNWGSGLKTPGFLVSDLGTFTVSAATTNTLTTSFSLETSGRLFLAFKSAGATDVGRFLVTQSQETLGDGISALSLPVAYALSWPKSFQIPMTAVTTDFPAVQVAV